MFNLSPTLIVKQKDKTNNSNKRMINIEFTPCKQMIKLVNQAIAFIKQYQV